MNANKALIALTAALALHTTAALAVVFTNNTTIAIGVTTYDGQDIVVSNCTLTVNGPHSFTSLLVTSNGVVTHTANPAGTTSNRLELTILTDATVALGGAIQADGRGYSGDQGPGAGQWGCPSGCGGGGGGYGGLGGRGSSGGYVAGGTNYGSLLQPTDFGSGGGSGGAGGGAIRLSVGGTLTVNGQISANGSPAPTGGWYWGGGSGGSIWLTVGTLSGTGGIAANGGAGAGGGGGGGGRIAIYYASNLFPGSVSARGGTGYQTGGAGTIYTKASSQVAGSVLVDNGGNVGTLTPLSAPEPFALTIAGQALVYPETNLTFQSLLVASNGTLFHLASQPGLNLVIQQDATVALGGVIQANGLGYGANEGPGAGQWGCPGTCSGGGGGYGGLGGRGSSGGYLAGGTSYGSLLQPTDFGSGGGSGGAGGGAIRLSVGGTLTVNGQISANGSPVLAGGWPYGGGSGGSIWLTVGTLSGTGVLSAIGGSSFGGGGNGGGGGGGGRIAIYYASNLFSGSVSAQGGTSQPGGQAGGAGTIYTKAASLNTGDLVVDNGGTNGAMTLLTLPVAFNVTITNAAVVYSAAPVLFNNLNVAAGGTVTHLPALLGVQITCLGNLTIQAGGVIQADGLGYSGGQGPGAGGTGCPYTCAGGGGGHGGLGGMGNAGEAWVAGGTNYGSILQPAALGSGGGSGGAGGGAIRLNVGGTLTVDGQVRANGLTPTDTRMGGGSGGAIWLTVGTLAGTGSIAVNGGTNSGNGGGGAGGRIAVYHTNNLFAGTLSAQGGAGAEKGGAGTIYTKAAAQPFGEVLIQNLGTASAMTPLTAPEPLSLTVAGLTTVFPQTALILGNLRLATNATLTHLLTQSNVDLTVLHDLTIEPGAVIGTDGLGNDPGQGGGTWSCPYYCAGGGAGYGGVGGLGNGGHGLTVAGGTAYGSAQQPTDKGSRGGSGGMGGGAIRLSVGGTLTVNGQISANGSPAPAGNWPWGGGSGGSIWVNAGTLTGASVLSAIGGSAFVPSGDNGGGGGAGGRVAVYATNTTGFGNVTNHVALNGGSGAQYGGSGTLYFLSGYLPLQGIGHTPVGVVMSTVSNVDVFFNIAANPATVTTADVSITTPGGSIPAGQITVEMLGGMQLRIGFPPQSALGAYQVQVGPQIADLYGNAMAQPYVAAFAIAAPLISGTVRDTNGLPVAGVAVQPSGGLTGFVTAADGQYSLSVLPSWTGTVTPSKAGWMFVPGVRAYTNLTANLTSQDYTLVVTTAAALSSRQQSANCHVEWYGISGVGYQPQSSTNLVNWANYGSLLTGTNGPLSFNVAISSAPRMFFRIRSDN